MSSAVHPSQRPEPATEPPDDATRRGPRIVRGPEERDPLCGWTPPMHAVPPMFTMQDFDTWKAEWNTLGHGFVFQQLFGHIARFSYEQDAWYVYDGRSWVRDRGDQIVMLSRLARERFVSDAKRLGREAEELLGATHFEEQQRESARSVALKFKDHVGKTLSTPKALATMVDAAKVAAPSAGDPISLAIDVGSLDRRPELLCVENGVVNLRTGGAMPHDPELQLSRIAPIVYRPGAEAPRFMKFLLDIMGGDRSRVQFLLRVLGYLLTGESRERKIVVFHGANGDNGKTTLTNILRALLGSALVGTLPVAALLAKRFGADEIDVGLASIDGRRVVVALEPNAGSRFNTGIVKALAGNDRDGIAARTPYQRTLTNIRTGAKVLMVTNHLPVWENDEPFNNRFLVVPFTKSFKGQAADRHLEEILLAEEADGIFALLVQGARDYYARGLRIPSEITEAAQASHRDADTLGTWFDACCTPEQGAVASVTELFESYAWHARHVQQAGDDAMLSLKAFSAALDRYQVSRARRHHAGSANAISVAAGIRLRVGEGGEVLDRGGAAR